MYPYLIANTIIQKSFETARPINLVQLQLIYYMVVSDHAKVHATSLLDPSDHFSVYNYGPGNASIHSKFHGISQDKTIRRYLAPAGGNTYVASDNQVLSTIDRVFRPATAMSTVTLSDILRGLNSVWITHRDSTEEFSDIIGYADIAADTDFYHQLNIPVPAPK